MKKGDRNIKIDLKKRRGIKLAIIVVICILIFVLLFILYMKNISNTATGKAISDLSDSSALVTVNFSDEVGRVGDNFYGANIQRISMEGTNILKIDTSLDSLVYNGNTNMSWHKQNWLDSKMNYFRDFVRFDYFYHNSSNGNLNFTGNLTKLQQEVQWAYENNNKILINFHNRVPSFLANSSSWCNNDNTTCPPNNYTIWNNMVLDIINRTTLGGQYIRAIDIEIGNEPYGSGFLANLATDNINKSLEFVKIYNSTYNEIKAIYPNVTVGGPAGYTMIQSPNLMKTFLSNMTNKMDFCSIHPYLNNYITGSISQQIIDLVNNASYYGANCSRIILSEWNLGYSTDAKTIKNEISKVNEYEANIGSVYINIMTFNSSYLIQEIFWQWAESYKYTNNAYYPEYPQRWSMVSEPRLDNVYYPPYNITKNFATYHSAGSMVVKSTSSSNNIMVVASKKEESQYITMINKGNDTLVNLNIFESVGVGIRDLETGETYNINNHSVGVGRLKQYQIRYFVNFNN